MTPNREKEIRDFVSDSESGRFGVIIAHPMIRELLAEIDRLRGVLLDFDNEIDEIEKERDLARVHLGDAHFAIAKGDEERNQLKEENEKLNSEVNSLRSELDSLQKAYAETADYVEKLHEQLRLTNIDAFNNEAEVNSLRGRIEKLREALTWFSKGYSTSHNATQVLAQDSLDANAKDDELSKDKGEKV